MVVFDAETQAWPNRLRSSWQWTREDQHCLLSSVDHFARTDYIMGVA